MSEEKLGMLAATLLVAVLVFGCYRLVDGMIGRAVGPGQPIAGPVATSFRQPPQLPTPTPIPTAAVPPTPTVTAIPTQTPTPRLTPTATPEVRVWPYFHLVPQEQRVRPGEQTAVQVVLEPGNTFVNFLFFSLHYPNDELTLQEVTFGQIFPNQETGYEIMDVDYVDQPYLEMGIVCGSPCVPYTALEPIIIASVFFQAKPTAQGVANIEFVCGSLNQCEGDDYLVYNAINDEMNLPRLDIEPLSRSGAKIIFTSP